MAVTAWMWVVPWALAAEPRACGDALQVRWKDIEAQPAAAVTHSLRCARGGDDPQWSAVHLRSLVAWGEEDLAWRRLSSLRLSDEAEASLRAWLGRSPLHARPSGDTPDWARALREPSATTADATADDPAFWVRDATTTEGRRAAVATALQTAQQHVWAGRFGSAEIELGRAGLWARLGGMTAEQVQAQLELMPLLMAWDRRRELDNMLRQLARGGSSADEVTLVLAQTLQVFWQARDGDPIGADAVAMGLQDVWKRHEGHGALQGVRHLWEAQHAEALRDGAAAAKHWSTAADHLDAADWRILGAYARAESWAMEQATAPFGPHDTWPTPLHLSSRIQRSMARRQHAPILTGLPGLLEQWAVQGSDWQADGWVQVALASARGEGEREEAIGSGVRLLALADEDLEGGRTDRALERYETSEARLASTGIEGLRLVAAERQRWGRLVAGEAAPVPPTDDPWTLPWVLPWLLDVDAQAAPSAEGLRRAVASARAAHLQVMAGRLSCSLGRITEDGAERIRAGRACVWLQPDLGLSLVLTGAQRLALAGKKEEVRPHVDWLMGWPQGPLDETVTLRRSLSQEERR